METFSGNARSFKMDRRSPQASELKLTVSKKLFEFLGNYTDDVLANKAKDDLEAFLGQKSGEFVGWLWEHLLENYSPSKTPSSLSNTKEISDTRGRGDDVGKEQRASGSKHLQNHATTTSDHLRDGKQSMQSTFSSKPINSNTTEVSEDFQHWHPSVDAPLTKLNTEGMRPQIYRSEIHEKRTDNKQNEAVKYGASRERCSSVIADSRGQCLQYHDQYKKIVIRNNESSHQLLHPPKREEVTGNLQLVVTENPDSRLASATSAARSGVPSSAMDTAVSHSNHRSHGNVWDRLGKPCEDNNVMMADKSYPRGFDITKKRKIEYDGEGLDRCRLMLVVPDSRLNRRLMEEITVLDNVSSKVIPNSHADDHGRWGQGVNTMPDLNNAGNSERKRLLVETDSGNSSGSLSGYTVRHIQDKEVFQGLQCSEYDDLQGLNAITSNNMNGITSNTSTSDSPISATTCQSVKTSYAVLKPVAHKASQKQPSTMASLSAPTQTPLSVRSSLLTQPESPHNAENYSANQKSVKDEVLHVKLKLLQIEMEMSKLRLKQAEMKNDSKLDSSLRSGAFAATKEALSSHFSKCGMVVRTILLTDPVTTQPKGAAYVSFASKESADKAIALNGTSFFSRTLKVMRKADMPAALSVPILLPAKPQQPWHSPQSHKKGPLQKPYSSSHLQWRRDNPAYTENSLFPRAGRLEASKAADQEVGDSSSQQIPRPLTYVRMEARSATETPSVS